MSNKKINRKNNRITFIFAETYVEHMSQICLEILRSDHHLFCLSWVPKQSQVECNWLLNIKE